MDASKSAMSPSDAAHPTAGVSATVLVGAAVAA
jgi:hypothetical protein